jgi:hypothetical protein
MDRRRFLGTVGAGFVIALAGCPGPGGEGDDRSSTSVGSGTNATPSSVSTPGTPPDTTTQTPFPGGEIDFPEGPKSAPSLPSSLDRERVTAFVRTYERRFVYNTLWIDEHSGVRVSCSVDGATRSGPGWRVLVSCRGSAHHGSLMDRNGTVTETQITRDYVVRYFVYFVDEDSVYRREAKPGEVPG